MVSQGNRILAYASKDLELYCHTSFKLTCRSLADHYLPFRATATSTLDLRTETAICVCVSRLWKLSVSLTRNTAFVPTK